MRVEIHFNAEKRNEVTLTTAIQLRKRGYAKRAEKFQANLYQKDGGEKFINLLIVKENILQKLLKQKILTWWR